MPRYRSSGWSGLSFRFIGSLVVFAVAALSGAVIGGVGIYIINDAINPPPSAEASAHGPVSSAPKQAKAQDNKSSAATAAQPQSSPKPVASPATSKTASETKRQNESHAATQDAAQQAGQKPLDALSRAHPTETSAPAADSAPHGPSAQAEGKAPDDANAKSAAARDATDKQTDVARKKAAAKKRLTRRSAPGVSQQAQSGPQRSLYDYYDRDGQQQRTFSQTRQRVIVRRQNGFDDRWDDRNRQADRFPAQPRPSFFGPFGRGGYNDRDDNW